MPGGGHWNYRRKNQVRSMKSVRGVIASTTKGLFAAGWADARREEGRCRRLARVRLRIGSDGLGTSISSIGGLAGAMETKIVLFSW